MARSARPSPAVVEAWTSLLEAHRRLLPRLDADLRAQHDIPLEWYDVLHQLYRAGGSLTMGQLGERLMVGASSCTRRVDRMAESGLVGRHRDASDARVIHATLTDQGRALARRAGATHLRSIQQHFGRHLDDEDAAQLGRALRATTPDPDDG